MVLYMSVLPILLFARLFPAKLARREYG